MCKLGSGAAWKPVRKHSIIGCTEVGFLDGVPLRKLGEPYWDTSSFCVIHLHCMMMSIHQLETSRFTLQTRGFSMFGGGLLCKSDPSEHFHPASFVAAHKSLEHLISHCVSS